MLAVTPFLSSFHYALGPTVALVAVLGSLGASRWVFSTTHRERRASADRSDFGLLVPIAESTDAAEAERFRAALTAAGVRATVARVLAPRGPVRVSADGYVLPAEPDRASGPTLRVLVFPADRERAQTLLAG